MDHAEFDGGVVIGYDASPPSEKAILWAAQDCDRRGCQLHVVRAWTVSSATRPDSWSPSYVPSLVEFEAAVRADMERQVAEVLRDHPDVEWSVHPVYNQPAKALIEASKNADLLVVGHRGGGGFAGLLIGSVSEQCVRHAYCPVVVVHTVMEE
jgi:nucleotide-binding universal stress UspA family protein